MSGTAGMNAEPSWYRQTSCSGKTKATTLATKPKNIPKAVQNCQVMVRAPRILAGEFSAARTGTVAPLAPIPIPMTRRTTKRVSHECVKAEAIGVAIKIRAVMKIVPRRPKKRFKGSDNQQPSAALPIYGPAFTTPTNHSSAWEPLPMPNSCGKPRFAPLLPV